MATIKGLSIEISGDVKPLNKALGSVNTTSRDLQKELRQVERLLKFDPSNTELLAQKQKILSESIDNTKEKIETLKEAEKQAQEQFKKGEITEEQYRALQREVAKTEQELKNLEKSTKEFGDSASRELKRVSKSLDEAGEKMTSAGKKMSKAVTAPVVAAAGVSFKLAADLEDAMGATEQIYGKSSESVKKWVDNLENYYGIAKSEAYEYSNMMGSMLQNIGGLTEKEAAEQSAKLIELAGDLSAMYGGSTADAVQALTGALKGNNTMLDNYGMAANDAMVKAKALEMGIYNGAGAMDLEAKQAATLALIMEQSSAAQGQAGREAEGSSGQMKAFATATKDLSSTFGEVLLPIITPLLEKLNELMKKFSDLSPETKKIIVVVLGIAAAIGPLLVALGMMATGLSSVMAVAALLTPVLGLLGGAVAFLMGPVGLAIVAVSALTAGLVYLWKTNDGFKNAVVATGKKIMEIVKKIFGIKTWLVKEAISIGSDFVKGIVDGIKNKAEFVVNAARDLGKKMTNSIKKFLKIKSPSQLMRDEVGKQIVLGVAAGIKDNESEAIKAARELAANTFKASKEWIDKKKFYNELNLNEELKAWQRIQKKYVEGSVERIEADRQVFSAKQNITNEITRIETEYNDAVKKRTDEIFKSFGLFSEVEKSETVSGEKLIKNLEDQNAAIKGFFSNLEELKDRGIGEDLANELKTLGVGASDEIKGLLALSDDDLQKYADLFGEKQKLANDQAISELIVLKEETDNSITELVDGVEEEFGRSPQIAQDMVGGLINGMNAMMPGAVSKARQIASAIMAEFDKISMPLSSSSDKKKKKKMSGMATGGSITSGTSLVGERGPELLTMSPGVAKVTPLGAGGVGDLASDIANAVSNSIAMSKSDSGLIALTVNLGTEKLADKIINLNQTALKNQGTMKIATVEV